MCGAVVTCVKQSIGWLYHKDLDSIQIENITEIQVYLASCLVKNTHLPWEVMAGDEGGVWWETASLGCMKWHQATNTPLIQPRLTHNTRTQSIEAISYHWKKFPHQSGRILGLARMRTLFMNSWACQLSNGRLRFFVSSKHSCISAAALSVDWDGVRTGTTEVGDRR